MAVMVKIICACGCGRSKEVRKADVARGWGKYYSKSCKARAQERKTGQYKRYLNSDDGDDYLTFGEGWDGHKGTF